jgi:type II secretory pathway component PulF
MTDWLEEWLNRQLAMFDDVLKDLVGPLIIIGLTLLPFAIVWAFWSSLRGIWRRRERAVCLLSLLEIGLQQGRTPEQTFLSVAARRVADMGPLFESVVNRMKAGLSLGAALDTEPRLLPPPARAMIKVGEELGDLRRVLPACRISINTGTARSNSVLNNLMVLLFVSPVGPVLIWIISIWVFPKLEDLAKDMITGLPGGTFLMFKWSVLFAKIIAGLWLTLWLASCLRDPQTRLHHWLGATLSGLIQRFNYLLPWRRQRMQRDFSVMLSLMLDAGLAEERALRLAAGCAANVVFARRVERALAELRRGVKLTDALGRLDDRGEFRWRLRNAVEPPRSFSTALAGWHDALDARAFQQEQAASQIITTGFVFLNGTMVGLVAVGSFELLIRIMEEAAW